MKKDTGLTLVELILAISIIGVLVAIVVPILCGVKIGYDSYEECLQYNGVITCDKLFHKE